MKRKMKENGWQVYFEMLPIAFAVADVADKGAKLTLQDVTVRYVNPALSHLRKDIADLLPGTPLFEWIFSEMAEKWLPSFLGSARKGEVHTLYGYEESIGRYLKLTVFPWQERGTCAFFLQDETSDWMFHRELYYAASHDLASNMLNRNSFQQYRDNFESAQKTSAGMLFVDINGLKRTNDVYGHKAGDALIKLVADTIHDCCDRTNPMFRIGGDEFVIMMENCTCDAVQSRAETLRNALVNESIPCFSRTLAAVGYSWSDDAISFDELMQQADYQMYLQKQVYYENEKICCVES